MKARLLIILLLLFSFTACLDPHEAPGKANQTGDENSFEVKKGESLSHSEFPLQLSLLNIEDSRCPQDVQCIHAGEVSTLVLVNSRQNPLQYLEQTLCLGCQEVQDSIFFEMDSDKYLLILKNVSPYPVMSQPQAVKSNTAELEIQRVR